MIWNVSIVQWKNGFCDEILFSSMLMKCWNDISFFPILFQSQIGNCFGMHGVYYIQEIMLNDKVLLMASPHKAWIIIKCLESTS